MMNSRSVRQSLELDYIPFNRPMNDLQNRKIPPSLRDETSAVSSYFVIKL